MQLILQVLLPAIIFAKNNPEDSEIKIRMKGGSIGSWAPSHLSVTNVLMPLLSHFGIQFKYNLGRHGFFPDLRGEIDLIAKPSELPLKPINFTERGKIAKIEIKTAY